MTSYQWALILRTLGVNFDAAWAKYASHPEVQAYVQKHDQDGDSHSSDGGEPDTIRRAMRNPNLRAAMRTPSLKPIPVRHGVTFNPG